MTTNEFLQFDWKKIKKQDVPNVLDMFEFDCSTLCLTAGYVCLFDILFLSSKSADIEQSKISSRIDWCCEESSIFNTSKHLIEDASMMVMEQQEGITIDIIIMGD